MKRKLFFFTTVISILFTLTSCDSGPDSRDLLLGTYSYTTTGNYVMHFAGQNINVPLAAGGEMRISKDGSGNRVKITGDNISSKGVVDGDILKVDPESQSETKDGVFALITAEYEPARLVNNTLNIKAKITGTITGGGQLGTLEGSQLVIATKQ
jgi:hypothetical protein